MNSFAFVIGFTVGVLTCGLVVVGSLAVSGSLAMSDWLLTEELD